MADTHQSNEERDSSSESYPQFLPRRVAPKASRPPFPRFFAEGRQIHDRARRARPARDTEIATAYDPEDAELIVTALNGAEAVRDDEQARASRRIADLQAEFALHRESYEREVNRLQSLLVQARADAVAACAERDMVELLNAVGEVPIRFWTCPVREHGRRDTVTVEWRDGVAHCTAPGCDRDSTTRGSR